MTVTALIVPRLGSRRAADAQHIAIAATGAAHAVTHWRPPVCRRGPRVIAGQDELAREALGIAHVGDLIAGAERPTGRAGL